MRFEAALGQLQRIELLVIHQHRYALPVELSGNQKRFHGKSQNQVTTRLTDG